MGRVNKLICFYAIAVGVTWTFWVPMALSSRSLIPALPYREVWRALGVIGPTVAALIMSSIGDSKNGPLRLLRSLLVWRIDFRWYLLALGSRSIVMGTAFIAMIALGMNPGLSPWSVSALLYAFLESTVSVFEELGWRGWALPEMLHHWNPTLAGLLLGVLWSAWHLPLFFTFGLEHASRSFMLYLLNMTAFSVICTWIYNHAQRSALMAVVFHTGFNIGLYIVPINPYHPMVVTAAWLAALAVVLLDKTMWEAASNNPVTYDGTSYSENPGAVEPL